LTQADRGVRESRSHKGHTVQNSAEHWLIEQAVAGNVDSKPPLSKGRETSGLPGESGTGNSLVIKGALAGAFLCVFALFSVAVKTELRREKSPVATLKIGERMPDFSLPDATGKIVKLSEVAEANKLVLINFWASWCGPCRVEMPSFDALYQAQKNNGFAILAISEDKERPKLDQYLKEKPVSFPVLLDQDGQLAKQLRITTLPTTILIEEGGKIRRVHEGVQPYLEFSIEAALKDRKQP
jgi:peroxiredoxin